MYKFENLIWFIYKSIMIITTLTNVTEIIRAYNNYYRINDLILLSKSANLLWKTTTTDKHQHKTQTFTTATPTTPSNKLNIEEMTKIMMIDTFNGIPNQMISYKKILHFNIQLQMMI